MNWLSLIERVMDLLCSTGCIALFIFFYGEYKIDRKKVALIYWIVGFSFSMSYWVVKLTKPESIFNFILMTISFFILDVLYVVFAKGKWYMNIVIIELFFVWDGIGVIFINYLFEKIFQVPYAEIMEYTGLSQLLCYEGFTVVSHLITNVITILIMRKFFPFHRIHNETVGSRMYWIIQLIAIWGAQGLVVKNDANIELSYLVEYGSILIGVFITVALSYSLLRKIVQKTHTKYIVQILGVQKEFYQDIYATYEEMRNLRHDLMNHLHQIELLQESDSNRAEQYSDEMKGKIEELDRYRNTTFIQLILEKLNQKKEYASVDLSYTGLEDESILQEKLSQNDILSIVRCMGEIGLMNTIIRDGYEMKYCIEQQKNKYQFVLIYPATKKLHKLTKEQKCAMKDAKKVLRYVANKENMTINIFKEKKIYRMEVTKLQKK